jgi:hypothetical protein
MTHHRIAQIAENGNPKSPETRAQTCRFLQIRLLQPSRSAAPLNGSAVLHGRLSKIGHRNTLRPVVASMAFPQLSRAIGLAPSPIRLFDTTGCNRPRAGQLLSPDARAPRPRRSPPDGLIGVGRYPGSRNHPGPRLRRPETAPYGPLDRLRASSRGATVGIFIQGRLTAARRVTTLRVHWIPTPYLTPLRRGFFFCPPRTGAGRAQGSVSSPPIKITRGLIAVRGGWEPTL